MHTPEQYIHGFQTQFYWYFRVSGHGYIRGTRKCSRRERSHPPRHHRQPATAACRSSREAIACPNTEFVAFADIYTRRLEDAKKIAPNAKTYLDYRYLLEDKSIDAVLIATPQHLHCEHFTAALDAGKHVYQEKTMAFTVDHAKRMRAAYQKARQARRADRASVAAPRAMSRTRIEFLKAGNDGQDHRDPRAHVPQHAARQAAVVAPDLSRHDAGEHLWKAFLGEAPKRDFDANRYINWRFFWDYSGGNVYENMCHQLAFWYKVMDLQDSRSRSP